MFNVEILNSTKTENAVVNNFVYVIVIANKKNKINLPKNQQSWLSIKK